MKNTHDHLLQWDYNEQPISTQFDDVYFSKHNGLEESRYVFITHNHLSERFTEIGANESFIIGETGFGTGLNFFATWQEWENTATASAHLHYISVEKYPLPPSDIQRAIAHWPELSQYSQRFLDDYKRRFFTKQTPGFHYFNFGRIHLLLIIDDANTGLMQLLNTGYASNFHNTNHHNTERYNTGSCKQWQGVHAWFLDGFSPTKNNTMWSPALFNTMRQLSHDQATLATFTAAGHVRRNLQQAGFHIHKVPGFVNKRDMITGRCNTECTSKVSHSNNTLPANQSATPNTSAPQYNYPSQKTGTPWASIHGHQAQTNTSVAIIGGGLAGCHTAYALAQRGFNVSLFDKNANLAQAASGNPQAMLYSKLSSDTQQSLGQYNIASLLYAQDFYRQCWQADVTYGQQCGVLQLDYDDKSTALHHRLWETFNEAPFLERLSAETTSKVANLSLNSGSLHFPYCGWLSPVHICQWLTESPNIHVIPHTKVEALNQTEQGWQLLGKQHGEDWESHIVKNVIIANAYSATQLPHTQWLPLNRIRGQISYLSTQEARANQLNCVLCAGGYIAPRIGTGEIQTIGASFNLREQSTSLSADDHYHNIARIQRDMPGVLTSPSIAPDGGRVGFRCTSPDYLPIVGAVPHKDQFEQDYAALSYNAKQTIPVTGKYYPGLYVNTAHGSRGLLYTPMAALILTHLIAGAPPPTSQPLVDQLNPGRFIIRALSKRQR